MSLNNNNILECNHNPSLTHNHNPNHNSNMVEGLRNWTFR